MKIAILSSAAALAVLLPTIAGAQEKGYLQQSVPAPQEAFELTVATGYTEGFGQLQSGVGLPSVARAGIGIDVAAGARINRHWGLSIGGQYQEFNAQRADGARGFAGTLAAQYHIDPNLRLDPWVELGTGYRMLWENMPTGSPNALTHGFQIARARVGLDLRVSPEVALSPVIGADATTFLWRDVESNTPIGSPRLSTFVFAGLMGRFDISGERVGTASVTSATPE